MLHLNIYTLPPPICQQNVVKICVCFEDISVLWLQDTLKTLLNLSSQISTYHICFSIASSSQISVPLPDRRVRSSIVSVILWSKLLSVVARVFCILMRRCMRCTSTLPGISSISKPKPDSSWHWSSVISRSISSIEHSRNDRSKMAVRHNCISEVNLCQRFSRCMIRGRLIPRSRR